MNHVKLLDCTLRDGAYLIDKNFGERTIWGITQGLVKAGIDFIEIGFLQDEGFGDGRTVYRNAADAARFIPDDRQGCEFALLADYSRYSVANLDRHADGGVDAVRECFFKQERFGALDACRAIKEKGYRLFVQPVDILGYSDRELAEFMELVNEVEPYCFSIVDTFGSMYQEDLHRVFELVNHNLISTCRVGFHSHNNMQMSNALSQEFARMTAGKRGAVIDGTVSGMGRGAGNTPTELIAQYLVAKHGAAYDMDAVLDIIDSCMDNIRSRCSWGYTTEYFLAGSYSAHVNNIAYLAGKNSIQSRDIRYILNKIGSGARKRYDYSLLEQTYLGLMESRIDDSGARVRLKESIGERPVLILVPGRTVNTHLQAIEEYIRENSPAVISVNFVHRRLKADYVYMSNIKRYQFWKNDMEFIMAEKIMTSNFPKEDYDERTLVVSFTNLIKCGWDAMDNSAVMLLRLISDLGVKKAAVAGFDGYETDPGKKNYFLDSLELYSAEKNAVEKNEEISEMLADFAKTRKKADMEIRFITPSRFEKCFKT